jgi:hypothetical protein
MTQEQLAWGRVALVAGLVIVVVAAGAFMVLRRGPAQEDQKPLGEEQKLSYLVGFAYRGSEDNQPIENLTIQFPLVIGINNQVFSLELENWLIKWVSENYEEEKIEVENGKIVELVGARSAPSYVESNQYQSYVQLFADKLYPFESIIATFH